MRKLKPWQNRPCGVAGSEGTYKSLSESVFFIDDGVAGVAFDRPDFNRMIVEIEAENVTTVIVRDMSRLWRDYLKVGYYTEIRSVIFDIS